MATAADLAALRAADQELSLRAELELEDLFRSLAGQPAGAVRDALLVVMPAIVEEYGGAASAVAAEWYESVGGNRAHLVAPVPAVEVEERVRYRAGHLWAAGGVAAASKTLRMDANEFVRRPGRHTIQYSAERNGQRWVRVPRGERTCSFCLTLASRSAEWMYITERTAGRRVRDGEPYHGDCDCECVMADAPSDVPWDPEPYYQMYDTAAGIVGNRSDTKSILQVIRREFPDQVTDGVI